MRHVYRPAPLRVVGSLVVLAFVVGLAFLGRGFNAVAQDGAGEVSHPNEDAAFFAELAEDNEEVLEAQRALEESWETQNARDQRALSETKYRDLPSADSMALLRAQFGDVLQALDQDPARILEEVDATGFPAIDVAKVDAGPDPDDQHLLISPVPLQARDETGELEPVDMSLEDRGTRLRTDNAVSDISLPEEADEPIRVPQEDIAFDLANANNAGAKPIGDYELFYPDVLPDTDYLASPLAQGFETFLQLRSPRSPESFEFNLNFPQGRSLQQVGQSVEIWEEGETIARIAPPLAEDAQGRPVPVSLALRGSTIELTAEHRTEDLAYPILVDPELELACQQDTIGRECYRWLGEPGKEGTIEWERHLENEVKFDLLSDCRPVISCYGQGSGGEGLYVYAEKNESYPGTTYAHWHYRALGTKTYISMARFAGMHYRSRSNRVSPFPFVALSDSDHEAKKTWAGTTDFSQEAHTLNCVGTGDSCNSRGINSAVFGLGATDGISPTLPEPRDFYLGGAIIEIGDTDAPRVTQAAITGPGGWQSSAAYDVDATASEEGLGPVKIQAQTANGQSATHYVARSRDCLGIRGSACPSPWSVADLRGGTAIDDIPTDALNQGENTVDVYAFDALGKRSDARPVTRTIKVDRTAPEISATGGAGIANQVPGTAPDQTLNIAVTDGAPGIAANRRSGVKSVTVTANGETLESFNQDCTAEAGSCSFPRAGGTKSYKLDLYKYATDRVDLEVVARDQLGQQSRLAWTVNLAGGPPKVERVISCVRSGPACIDTGQVQACTQASCQTSQPGVASPDAWINGDGVLQTAVLGRDVGADQTSGAARTQRGIEAARLFFPDSTRADAVRNDCPALGCPEYGGLTFEYTDDRFLEGLNTVAARVRNRANDSSAVSRFEVRVDRTKPTIDAARLEESPLYKNREVPGLVAPLKYDLFIRGSDGGALYRSGVNSIRVLVARLDENGNAEPAQQKFARSVPCPQSGWDDGCTREDKFTFDPSAYQPGRYRITAQVTDHAGNVAERQFDVRVRRVAAKTERLGLEQYFDYDTVETGAGAQAHANLATGNLVWHKPLADDPGRGLSTLVDLTHNSFDWPITGDVPSAVDTHFGGLEYDEAGIGNSLSISGVTRINEPLGGLQDAGALIDQPASIQMTDADGTVHSFQKLIPEAGNSVNDVLYGYKSPAGVNLYLRQFSDPVRDAQRQSISLAALLPENRPKAWAMTRPDGTTYFYDGWGYLRSIEDRNRNVMRFTYEKVLLATGTPCPLNAPVVPGVCEPRLVEVEDPYGTDSPQASPERTLEIKYHPQALADISSTPGNDEAGASGKVRAILDHANREIAFDYNGNGTLRTLTEARGTDDARTTQLAYDAPDLLEHPQLTKVVDPMGGETLVRYEDDERTGETSRRVKGIIDREEARSQTPRQRSYTYASESETVVTDTRNFETRHQLDALGRPTSITDPLGSRTQLSWDADNNVTQTVTGLAGIATTGGSITSYQYNDNGLLEQMIRPGGRTTTFDYDDGPGIHTSELGSDLDCDEMYVSDLRTMTRPMGPEHVWTYEVEEAASDTCGVRRNGNVLKEINPSSEAVVSEYYAAGPNRGMLKSEKDATGAQTLYPTYSADGKPAEVVDPKGAATSAADDGRWIYRYDEAGNLRQVVDPRGSSGLSASPGAVTPAQVTARASDAFTTTVSYDLLDRMVGERLPKDSASGAFITRSYKYDKNGNLIDRTDGASSHWLTSFDRMDRPTLETDPTSAVRMFCYDSSGNLVREVSPRGRALDVGSTSADEGANCSTDRGYSVDYRYDGANQQVARIDRSSNSPDLVTSFSYDRRGNQTGVVAPIDNPAGETEQNVNQAIVNAGNINKLRVQRSYDFNDQLIETVEAPGNDAGALNLKTSYVYDLNGNRTEVRSPRGYAPGAPSASFTEYTTFNVEDQVTSVQDATGAVTSYTYDKAGRLETETSPRADETVTNDNDFTTTYGYDANGALISRMIPWSADQYAGVQGSKITYTRNAVGDPVQITDANGNSFRNTFYDAGQLRTTERPSWWTLDWGRASESPSPGRKFAAVGGDGATSADLAVPINGPSVVEAARPEDGAEPNNGDIPEARSLPTAGTDGDFASVAPESLPNSMPAAARDQASTPATELLELQYDGEMRLTGMKESPTESASRSIGYDGAGRIVSKSWAYKPGQPITHRFSYDPNGNLARVDNGVAASLNGADATAHSYRYTYDQFDRRIQELAPSSGGTDGAGAAPEVTNFGYDANGNLIAQETPRGARSDGLDTDIAGTADYTFRYTYDAADRLLSESNPSPNETWSYTYDEAGNLRTETSPLGKTTTYTYDAANRTTQIQAPSPSGSNRTTTMIYDRAGNLTQVSAPGSAASVGAAEIPRVTKVSYDGRNLPWMTTEAFGTSYARSTATEYDANGNLRRTINGEGLDGGADDAPAWDGSKPNASSAARNATVREYNADNQLTEVHLPWSPENGGGLDGAAENSKRYKQEFRYDPRGRLLSTSNPYLGSEKELTTYAYFENGWIAGASDPTVVDRERRKAYNVAVSYQYDQNGNQTEWQTNPSRVADIDATSPTSTPLNGRKVTREYYPSGLLKRRVGLKTSASGTVESRRSYSYGYNENRSLTSVTDQLPPDTPAETRTRVTEIVRDASEREIAVNETWGGGASNNRVAYDTKRAFDRDGAVTDVWTDGSYDAGVYTGGKQTHYTYDGAGRETAMTVTGDGKTRTFSSTYYSSDQLKSQSRQVAAGAVTTDKMSYRADGLMAEMNRSGGNSKSQTYAYDANGNRTRDERGTYTYNARDQVTSWQRASGIPNAGTSVDYKVLGSGQVEAKFDSGAENGLQRTDYIYEGERLMRTETTKVRSFYSYDDLGNLMEVRSQSLEGGVFPPAPTPPNSSRLCSEELSNAPNVTSYCYDEFSRMVASRGPGLEPESYVYDGLDRRDYRVTGAGGGDKVREYSYVGLTGDLSREATAGGRRLTYDYDSAGQRLAQRSLSSASVSEVHPYAFDANGSVEAVEQEDGSINSDDRYRYDPYGALEDPNLSNSTPADEELGPDATANPFRFQGFYFDSAAKTYDMEARAYRPQEGRFLSEDRFEAAGADVTLQADPLTQNRYAFAGGNPISRIEFDGHSNCTAVCDPGEYQSTQGGQTRRIPRNGGDTTGPSAFTGSINEGAQPGVNQSTGAAAAADTRAAVQTVSNSILSETRGLPSPGISLKGFLSIAATEETPAEIAQAAGQEVIERKLRAQSVALRSEAYAFRQLAAERTRVYQAFVRQAPVFQDVVPSGKTALRSAAEASILGGIGSDLFSRSVVLRAASRSVIPADFALRLADGESVEEAAVGTGTSATAAVGAGAIGLGFCGPGCGIGAAVLGALGGNRFSDEVLEPALVSPPDPGDDTVNNPITEPECISSNAYDDLLQPTNC